MTILDPRVEGAGHHLCHVLAENRGTPMSDKDRHDIFFTTRQVAAYWKKDEDRRNKEATIRNFNEIAQWSKREQPDNHALHKAIETLRNGGSIR